MDEHDYDVQNPSYSTFHFNNTNTSTQIQKYKKYITPQNTWNQLTNRTESPMNNFVSEKLSKKSKLELMKAKNLTESSCKKERKVCSSSTDFMSNMLSTSLATFKKTKIFKNTNARKAANMSIIEKHKMAPVTTAHKKQNTLTNSAIFTYLTSPKTNMGSFKFPSSRLEVRPMTRMQVLNLNKDPAFKAKKHKPKALNGSVSSSDNAFGKKKSNKKVILL